MAVSRAIAAIKRAEVVEAVADGATYQEAAELAGIEQRRRQLRRSDAVGQCSPGERSPLQRKLRPWFGR